MPFRECAQSPRLLIVRPGSAFAAGARRVAIIGTDVPAAGREHVMEALRSLDDHDVVLGPTHDGGY